MRRSLTFALILVTLAFWSMSIWTLSGKLAEDALLWAAAPSIVGLALLLVLFAAKRIFSYNDAVRRRFSTVLALTLLVENYSIKPQYINSGLEALGTTPLAHGCKLIELIPRPQITLENIAELVPAFRTELDKVPVSRKEEIIEAAEILIKYSGYIRREQIIADKINRLENIHIKGKFDYNAIQSLSTEARQKLTRIDPDTIAQASRIPGISPSDINILLVMLGR